MSNRRTLASLSSSLYLLLSMGASGCGGDDGPCEIGELGACEGALVCEVGIDGEGVCAAPLAVTGRVFDLATDAPIAGARVLALDANGVALSTAAITIADGSYTLSVPTERDAEGLPVGDPVVLRVSAAGYQTFALAPRVALPIDRTAPTEVAGVLTVASAATDVGLTARAAIAGGTIEGTIESLDAGGALVVATLAGSRVATALADRDGAFVLFDVPAGVVQLEGYRAGIRILPADATVAPSATTTVVLGVALDGLSTVEGTVQIVNAPGGSSTSVILVVESTFDETFVRGEAPAGLRAAPVSGGFSITGVAPGRYVALAAFENDDLVRDPDTSIGGTEIVHFEVPEASGTVSLGDGFKVTAALAVVSPGADGLTILPLADPTFVWADDSSEDGYEVRVYDALGALVHEDTMVPRVTGSSSVSYTWSGATLTSGMIYQYRALSFSEDRDGAHIYLSATEDLRGIFQIE
jgi:hypothetical protein